MAIGLALASSAALAAQAPSDPAAAHATPRAVYTAACAACHGDDGRGAPLARRGFDVEPPDLTECNFATREAPVDWTTVARHGGPARAFDRRMPAFGDALSEEQLALAVAHAKSFCVEAGWPPGELNLPRPMFTEKAFVEDEVVVTVGAQVDGPQAIAVELLYEGRVGRGGQVEVIVPFSLLEPDPAGGGRFAGGLGDAALGYKQVMLAAPTTGTIFAAIGEVVLPTGNADNGLGSGAARLEHTLCLGQLLGPAGFLHLQAGLEVPLAQEVEVEALWRGAWGYTFRLGDYGRIFSPMVELLGAVALEEGAAPELDLVPQFQIALSTRQHVLLGVAARIPLDQGTGRHVGVWTYVLWDWFDGSFTQGW
jgi:mono/diheme cytochrome c family protein